MAELNNSVECTDKCNTNGIPCIVAVSKLFYFTTARDLSYVFRGQDEGQEVASIKAPILAGPYAPIPNEGSSVNPVTEDVCHCEESLKYDEQAQHKV